MGLGLALVCIIPGLFCLIFPKTASKLFITRRPGGWRMLAKNKKRPSGFYTVGTHPPLHEILTPKRAELTYRIIGIILIISGIITYFIA